MALQIVNPETGRFLRATAVGAPIRDHKQIIRRLHQVAPNVHPDTCRGCGGANTDEQSGGDAA